MDQQGSAPTPLSQLLARGPLPGETLARWGAELAEQLAEAGPHGDIRPEAVVINDDHAHLTGFGQPGADPRADIHALGALLQYAGAAFDPRYTALLARMGHPDPAQRPTAGEVAEHLRRLAGLDQPTPSSTPEAAGPAVPELFGPPLETKRRPRNRRRGLAVIGLVAVLVLVAAGGGVWWWLRRPPTVSAPLASGDPIGDIRTVDACALLDSAALQRFGATRLYPEDRLFAGCSVAISPNATEWDWAALTVDGPALDDHDLVGVPFQRARAVTIYHIHADPSYCSRFLVLPDRARITLAAYPAGKTSSLDLCAVADTLVQSALRALDTPSLPRLPRNEPPNSLVGQNACNLVDEATLRAAVPGLDTARRDQQRGGWSCEWGGDMATADPPTVDISFFTGSQRSPGASDGEQATTIGGRAALVNPNIWYVTSRSWRVCEVTFTHRAFQGAYDQPMVEQVVLNVHLTVATPPDAQCATATTIAQAVAAKLPPAS